MSGSISRCQLSYIRAAHADCFFRVTVKNRVKNWLKANSAGAGRGRPSLMQTLPKSQHGQCCSDLRRIPPMLCKFLLNLSRFTCLENVFSSFITENLLIDRPPFCVEWFTGARRNAAESMPCACQCPCGFWAPAQNLFFGALIPRPLFSRGKGDISKIKILQSIIQVYTTWNSS
jgi:hypothetical protein